MSFRYFVIDDAAFIRELIKGLCEPLGGVCVGEGEGQEDILSAIRKTLPEVVFIDLVLPGKNGLQVATEIRKAWPEARLIACSSLDKNQFLKKAQTAGIDDYIEKPFTQESFTSVLKKQISQKKEVAT